MRKLLFSLIMFASCSISPKQEVKSVEEFIGVRGIEIDKPGLEQAKKIIWEYYGESGTPPRVLIVEEKDLDCTDPNVDRPGFKVLLKTGVGCRQGFTFSTNQVSIAWFDDVPIYNSSLAHEYMHAHQAIHFVIEDDHNGYRGDNWGPGGLVDQARYAVRISQ